MLGHVSDTHTVLAAAVAAVFPYSCLALLLDDASATHSTADIKLPDTVLTTATVWWSRWYSTKHDTLFHRCDLLGDISQQLITLIQHISIWFLHGFGCNVLDALLMLNIRAALLSIVKRLRSHRSDQAVLMKLNNSLPDAEVCCCGEAGESECVICRDKMTTAKKLPCGHVFHLQVSRCSTAFQSAVAITVRERAAAYQEQVLSQVSSYSFRVWQPCDSLWWI